MGASEHGAAWCAAPAEQAENSTCVPEVARSFIFIIIIMLPNQAIASTPSAPRPSGAEGRGSTASASSCAVFVLQHGFGMIEKLGGIS
jgi:hypothetical protein